MVNEVGKEITIHRHQLSFYSATVNEFHITAPPTRLRSSSTNLYLINFWAATFDISLSAKADVRLQMSQITNGAHSRLKGK